MTDGPVVIDAGPLVALSLADCLGVLHLLFGSVLVPEAVFCEVVDQGAGRVGSDEVAHAPFLSRQTVHPEPDPLLAATLGRGEAEVITLAYREDARLALSPPRGT